MYYYDDDGFTWKREKACESGQCLMILTGMMGWRVLGPPQDINMRRPYIIKLCNDYMKGRRSVAGTC